MLYLPDKPIRCRNLLVSLPTKKKAKSTGRTCVVSKARYFNEHYLQIIFSMLDLDLSSIKKSPAYSFLREYGQIAA